MTNRPMHREPHPGGARVRRLDRVSGRCGDPSLLGFVVSSGRGSFAGEELDVR